MANTILVKRSAVQNKTPLVTDLSLGEFAINTYDGKVYIKKNNGADAIVDITANQTVTISGDATGSGTTSITMTLATTGVTAGTYNNVTVDAKGRVTSGSNTSYLTAVPVATSSALGGVKVGTNIAIAGDGTISVPTLPASAVTGLATVATTGNFSDLNGATKNLFVASVSTNAVYTNLNTWVDQALDVEYIKDSAFTHSTTTTNSIVTITKAGRYRLTVQASAFRSTGSSVSWGLRIASAPTSTGTYTQLQSASAYSIANAASILQSCILAEAIVSVTAGQSFKIQGGLTTVGGVTLPPASFIFTIQEL